MIILDDWAYELLLIILSGTSQQAMHYQVTKFLSARHIDALSFNQIEKIEASFGYEKERKQRYYYKGIDIFTEFKKVGLFLKYASVNQGFNNMSIHYDGDSAKAKDAIARIVSDFKDVRFEEGVIMLTIKPERGSEDNASRLPNGALKYSLSNATYEEGLQAQKRQEEVKK